MTQSIKVIEKSIDFPIPQAINDQICDLVLSPQFTWHYIPDATYLTPDGNASFAHVLVNEYEPTSPFYDVFSSVLAIIAKHAGFDRDNVYRARLGLLYPSSQKHNAWHTDYNTPHTTVLWYVNGGDGDTMFRHESFKPVKNGVLVFNGLETHASSPPTKGVRIVLNVNLMIP